MKKKRIGVTIVLIAFVLSGLLVGCNSQPTDNLPTLRFQELYTVNDNGVKEVNGFVKQFDGQKVKIIGFMAEQTPVDGRFVYLVSKPLQTCPFCVIGEDNTKLDVVRVVDRRNRNIDFTTQPVEIVGTLTVAPTEDSFGYTTQFEIRADKINVAEESPLQPKVLEYYKLVQREDIPSFVLALVVGNQQALFAPAVDDPFLTVEEKGEIIRYHYQKEFIDEGLKLLNDRLGVLESLAFSDPDIQRLHQVLIDMYRDSKTMMVDANKTLYTYVVEEDISTEEVIILLDGYIDENEAIFYQYKHWETMLLQ